jgi:hypothetical protein
MKLDGALVKLAKLQCYFLSAASMIYDYYRINLTQDSVIKFLVF